MKSLLLVLLLSTPIFGLSQKIVCVYDSFEMIDNDTVNRIVNDVKEGFWIDYEINIESFSCFSSDDCYHKQGINYIKSKGEFSNGKKIGEWLYFYETGEKKKKEKYLLNGEIIEDSIEFFKNGKIKSKQNWNKGKLKSLVVYYENGNLHFESKLNEEKIRSFQIYYKTGEMKFQGKNVIKWEIKKLVNLDKQGNRKKITKLNYGKLLSRENLIEYL